MTFKCFLLFSAFLAQMPWWQCLVSPPPLICSHSSSVSFWALPPHAATSVWKCCTCAVEEIQPNEHVHLFFSVVSLAAERPGSLWTSSTVPRFHSGFRKAHTAAAQSNTKLFLFMLLFDQFPAVFIACLVFWFEELFTIRPCGVSVKAFYSRVWINPTCAEDSSN